MKAAGEEVSSAPLYMSEIPFTCSIPKFKPWVPISYHGQKTAGVRSSKRVGCKRKTAESLFLTVEIG